MAAAPVSSSEFLDLVRKSGVVPQATLDKLADLPAEPASCAAALIAKGLITKFQAKLMLSGRYKGFKLGPYIVREQIGQGGMGAVYLAEHETLRRKVALKVLTSPKDSKDGQLALERFIREARASAALDHPNIVRLHDVGQSGATHFLVLEYVEGQTLEELLQKAGPISSSRAVGFIAQAAAGLQHAHEKGFVHRDIKPGNLILAKDGTIKLLDMGLARPADDNDKLTEILDKGAIVGTADFISPEQAMNANLDIRSDIYSLGATFYALVTGQPPFGGSTTQKLIQHQMKEAPSLMTLDRTFPAGLSRVVAKMLEKKPEHRFQSPTELITALAEWLPQDHGRKVVAGLNGMASKELENTLSEVESATQRFGSSKRLAVLKAKRNRYLLWGGGAAAVLLLGGLIGWAVSGPSTDKDKDDKPPVVNNNTPPASSQPKETPKITPKTGEPKKSPVSTVPQTFPKPPANVLVQLPMSHMKPFTLHLSRHQTGTNAVLNEDKQGAGSLPPLWYKWLDNLGSEADILVEETSDGNVLGLRNTSGKPGFSLNSPEFDTPSEGRVLITLTYLTDENSPGGVVRYRPTKPKAPTWDAVPLPPTRGVWKTITQEIDLKGSGGGLFELYTTGSGLDGTLRFKSFEVSRIK